MRNKQSYWILWLALLLACSNKAFGDNVKTKADEHCPLPSVFQEKTNDPSLLNQSNEMDLCALYLRMNLTQEQRYAALLNTKIESRAPDSSVMQKKYGNIEEEQLFSVRNIGIFTVIIGSVAGLVYMLNQVTQAPF